MKLEVCMYVRTKDGFIHTVRSLNETFIEFEDGMGVHIELKEYITKSSHNLIDLIVEEDYVNGSCIIDIKSKYEIGKGLKAMVGKYLHGLNKPYFYIREQDIESIVTKEQFKSMEYIVKE